MHFFGPFLIKVLDNYIKRAFNGINKSLFILKNSYNNILKQACKHFKDEKSGVLQKSVRH